MLMKIMRKKGNYLIQKWINKMRKQSCPCAIRYHNVSMPRNFEQYYQMALHFYISWKNENG